MRFLLSSIGSRGDIQPLLALAVAVREHGHEARLCLPPDFLPDAQRLGLHATPVGPPLRAVTAAAPVRPTPEQAQQMIAGTVQAQFDAITQAAEGCELIVGATALQIAAPSVAQARGIAYVFAAYAPSVLPSAQHPPMRMPGSEPAPPGTSIAELWQRDAARWQALWGPPLNARRAALGLAPVEDVRAHVLTATPWLAADAWLAPWDDAGNTPYQPGGWMLDDTRALSPELETFLDAGPAPIYIGLGSMHEPEGFAAPWLDAARACGRRVVVSRGWGGLSVAEGAGDVLAVDDSNHRLLFPRVAAVLHHGGAGTTLAATRAGVPQLIAPQIYDQPYWASRITTLRLGVAVPPQPQTADACAALLAQALSLQETAAVREAPQHIEKAGAEHAARRLIAIAQGQAVNPARV